MALSESDIEIWVAKGGLIIAFGAAGDDEGGTHVCTSERELVTRLLERIDLIRDNRPAEAADKAMRDKK